jgi:crotonobetainyl-CoA:carnitine CoA-transferase CaiB-like acyl-CoA transferase
MFEATASTMVEPLMDFLFNHRQPQVTGNRDPLDAPGNVYPCQGLDQWVAISVSTDQQWHALCATIGRPDLAADPRFVDALSRKRNEDALDAYIADWTRQCTPLAAAEALQRAGVPAGPTYRFADFLADPQVRARGFVHEHENLRGGMDITLSVPWTEEGKRPVQVRRASGFGEDNEYVFQQLLSISDHEYRQLVDQHVIF